MSNKVPYALRRRLLALRPGDTVRVHTYQSGASMEAARRLGYWTGDERFVCPDYAVPYAWMRAQMAERLPAHSGDLPVWCYLGRQNLRQAPYRPDTWLVVADVPFERVLVSDHDRWERTLDGDYVPETWAEWQALRAAGLRPNGVDNVATPAMVGTWHRVFDYRDRADPDRFFGQPRRLQACVDRIHAHEVVRVSVATGRVGRNARDDI